jgi:hypothetical protein
MARYDLPGQIAIPKHDRRVHSPPVKPPELIFLIIRKNFSLEGQNLLDFVKLILQ